MQLIDECSPTSPQDTMTTIGKILSRHGGSILTGPFGTALKASEYTATGVPVISVSEVGFGRIHIEDRTPRVSEGTTSRLTKYVLRDGDIVFARKGAGTAVERSALVTVREAGWFLGSDGIRLRLPSCCDPKFVSYWFQSNRHRQWMISNCVGTTMPSLNQGIIERIPITLPDLTVQRELANVLGSLDDKIELNRQTNETLEAMARTLFRSWFVDFDPVRAKADGQMPHGLDASTAKLFPDSFEASALGPIPKGWRVEQIGKVVDVVGGSTPSTDEASYWSGQHRFATPKDMAALNSPVLLTTERAISATGLERISSGLLPPGTVLLSSRAPIGYLAINEVPVAVNQGFIAMKCPDGMPNHYVLHWVRENMNEIIAHANGTTFLEISKMNFRPLKALVPDAKVLKAFADFVSLLHQRVIANLRESNTLAATRDALLPKLLSGEIRVEDVGHSLEKR